MENITTSRKEKQLLDTLYNRVGVSVSHDLVNDFDQWKSRFKDANKTFDFIYCQPMGLQKAGKGMKLSEIKCQPHG